ncbi:MAG: hypothetical protein PHS49_07120, partial [Candidatus Gracilibacteria bacterium]|nr:hypothetical protein [Candidatus Gracilibacteria bacterium]
MSLKKIILYIISFIIFIIGMNNTFAYTTVSGNITGNITWTTGTTYYVSSSVTIPVGSTLTIEPGVVIKMNSATFFYVRGVLNVNGTIGNKAVFTSYKDNTVGEIIAGNLLSPAWGNWYNIDINGTPTNGSIINYAEIRHANYGIGITNSNTIV